MLKFFFSDFHYFFFFTFLYFLLYMYIFDRHCICPLLWTLCEKAYLLFFYFYIYYYTYIIYIYSFEILDSILIQKNLAQGVIFLNKKVLLCDSDTSLNKPPPLSPRSKWLMLTTPTCWLLFEQFHSGSAI